jgi:NADPH:quinone reductase-like Zn-dependent oxidoreductase
MPRFAKLSKVVVDQLTKEVEMKAIVQTGYGSPDVLALKEIDKLTVKDDEVLVRVHAAGLNAGDVFTMRGVPSAVRLMVGLIKPKKNHVPGWDLAGHVEAIGKNVTRFQPGDEVFGACNGSCAEFACTRESNLLPKPPSLTFEQAAAVPTAGVTALLGLRNTRELQPGQKILINGASGGVGTFAVQIAKSFGAEVTGVCSTRNVDRIRSIGADHVIDYTQEDFTQGGQRYDLILDNVGNHSFSDLRHALAPQGILQPNTGNAGMSYVFKALILSLFMRKQGRLFVANPKQENLVVLKELIEAGKVTPVIDRTYLLSDFPEAFRYLDQGHARGKVIITVEQGGK